MTPRPSIRAIFAWANERFSDHWPGLFALGFLVSIVPLTRMVLEQGDPTALHPWVGLAVVGGQELVLALGTAAMVLLVMRPPAARTSEGLREAVHDAPRLIAVKIAAALVVGIPTIALAMAVRAVGAQRDFFLTLIVALVLVPLGFICRMAFVGAVLERTGPLAAIDRAFRRGADGGLGTVFVLAILFSLVDQLPPLALAWVGNVVFPRASIPFTPHFPGGVFPYPAMSMPGRFGGGIPWWVFAIIRVATIPLLGYVTTLYTAAALEFAGADTTTRENPEDAIFAAYRGS